MSWVSGIGRLVFGVGVVGRLVLGYGVVPDMGGGVLSIVCVMQCVIMVGVCCVECSRQVVV